VMTVMNGWLYTVVRGEQGRRAGRPAAQDEDSGRRSDAYEQRAGQHAQPTDDREQRPTATDPRTRDQLRLVQQEPRTTPVTA